MSSILLHKKKFAPVGFIVIETQSNVNKVPTFIVLAWYLLSESGSELSPFMSCLIIHVHILFVGHIVILKSHLLYYV